MGKQQVLMKSVANTPTEVLYILFEKISEEERLERRYIVKFLKKVYL